MKNNTRTAVWHLEQSLYFPVYGTATKVYNSKGIVFTMDEIIASIRNVFCCNEHEAKLHLYNMVRERTVTPIPVQLELPQLGYLQTLKFKVKVVNGH